MDAETKTYIDRAIRWAMEALDSTGYQTLCLKFVEDAYEISNHGRQFLHRRYLRYVSLGAGIALLFFCARFAYDLVQPLWQGIDP